MTNSRALTSVFKIWQTFFFFVLENKTLPVCPAWLYCCSSFVSRYSPCPAGPVPPRGLGLLAARSSCSFVPRSTKTFCAKQDRNLPLKYYLSSVLLVEGGEVRCIFVACICVCVCVCVYFFLSRGCAQSPDEV
ncbi:hypothetical protein T492DRAFT_1112176 [Pavlovales sp. CCMP2436]|nr:hypothetical protein T492DRAFT_1112176 [Pavlovales sp. CCMP2436]